MVDTALHPSKDLAVAPFDFAQGKPQTYMKTEPLRALSFLSEQDISVRTS